MATGLEITKKSRTVYRSAFTRAANELEVGLQSENPDKDLIQASLEMLQSKFECLSKIDCELYDLLLETSTAAELEADIESCDVYAKKFTILRLKCNKVIESSTLTGSSDNRGADGRSTVSIEDNHTGMRKFRLPRIEFKHYDGSIKDWLAFWAQFKKVHQDESIDNHDKIEYLIQATLAGSRARQLVESYPAMSENYYKIIESMQSRFGREDLQIEVYVRELLKLILTNTTSKQKMEISSLYDQIETQLRALETLGITTDKCSAMLYPLIESCLPQDLLRVWQRSAIFNSPASGDDPTDFSLEIRLKRLMLFLKQEVENEQRISLAAEGFGLGSGMRSSGGDNAGQRRGKDRLHNEPTALGLVNAEVGRINRCLFCSGTHLSEACFKAQKMSLEQRKEVAAKYKACFRCLKIGHQSRQCRGRMRCLLCGRSHVSLMCSELLATTKQDGGNDKQCEPTTTEEPSGSHFREHTLANHTSTQVFLQTLRVTIKGDRGSKVVRALVDTGSQRSYILKDTATQLYCQPKRVEKVVHCLFGGSEMWVTHECFDITVCRGLFSHTFEALDQLTICGTVPPVFYGPWTNELDILGVQVSDSGQSGPIELLLGADVIGMLYTGRREQLPCGLIAMETQLGWTLMGKVSSKNGARSTTVMTTLNLFVQNASLTQLWELEALGIKEPSDKRSKEEAAIAARELFNQTIHIDSEGRYEVRLPWIEDHAPLSSNYSLTQKRLESVVRRLKSTGLCDQYEQIFAEWEAEGIIEKVSPDKVNHLLGHYLPHRPVIKESSLTTKIRPVFDASAHEKEKPALNHCLEKGPNLIEQIPSMLLRFREKRIGVVADIRKAFLQISVHTADRDFLKFLWLDSQGREVVYNHRRVVFGLNSSPFLLGATLDHHLSQCLNLCCSTKSSSNLLYTRETVEKLKRSFYVDNCMVSLSTEAGVEKFIRESTIVMKQGLFDLRGWERTGGMDFGDFEETCAVLGLNWHPKGDYLTLNYSFMKDVTLEMNALTKRQILALTQKVFDPIGFVSPTTLIPKLMLQQLWKDDLTWDQPVTEDLAHKFMSWINELHYLQQIKIPRWVMAGTNEAEELSLHTFCDASQSAYACVVFLRAVRGGKVSVFLLGAKARISPLCKAATKMTIPRLELLAATIGARLYSSLVVNFEQEVPCFFWSDSSTVVHWIQRKEEWGVFVWNRVNEIRKLTSADDWRHLPGVCNPADLPSRGCSPKQLLDLKWWEGPRWLYDDPVTWPTAVEVPNEEEINGEKKKKLVTTLNHLEKTDIWHFNYFQKYTKTVRMFGWIQRFINNCKRPDTKKYGELDADEHNAAEVQILKLVQADCFTGLNDSRLIGFSPMCDEKGLIRLMSRISTRSDNDDFRFPIVLPSKHPIVKSMIMEVHIKSCHVGTQGLLSLLRERFWLLNGRRTIRSVIKHCVVCNRFNSKNLSAKTPPLPMDRVRDAAVFEVTGVDFAGPLYLKTGEKAWICLFTCAVYRAVHLELTTSLSTSSFLQALRRFVARRGRPNTVYSDNGTNFLGAANAFATLDWERITRETAIQRITWKFNPPTAAWWGGFWERLIGVLKQILRRVLGRASLNYEELSTLLCECESVVNSRPLTYLSEDPQDLTALTPLMFLREQIEDRLPDCDVIDKTSFSRKIRKLQTLREMLRKRFRSEYLGQLKLFCDGKVTRPVDIGELVLIGSDNTKRLEWPIGRVVDVLPGKDGQIRLVKVETIKGCLLRPLQRLFPLECGRDPERLSELGDFKLRVRTETEGDSPVTSTECENPQIPLSQESCEPEMEDVGIEVEKTTRCGRISKIPSRYLD